MINWKVRIRNKAFWVAVIPAVILLIQTVASIAGYKIDLGTMGEKLVAVVDAVFALLAILGIVNDPTTAGIKDSEQAMSYEVPKE